MMLGLHLESQKSFQSFPHPHSAHSLSLLKCPTTPAGPRDAARCPQHQDKAPSPALPTVHVTAWLCQLLHAGPGAVAVLTADEGVAAEGLGLADNTLRLQGVGRADALPCHFITETCPAVTGYKGQKTAGFEPEPGTQDKHGERIKSKHWGGREGRRTHACSWGSPSSRWHSASTGGR